MTTHSVSDTALPAHPHLYTATETAHALGVDPDAGLASTDAAHRLDRFGPNRLPEPSPRSWASRLLAPFADVMIGVLLVAALISGWIGDLADTLVILVIVLLNATISIVQEWQADRALAALKNLAAHQAKVRRDGQPQTLPADSLVPGDVVILEAGDQIPADLRLHEAAQLQVDESALTGESLAVEKQTQALTPLEAGLHALGDRCNMAWKGSWITNGRASGVVVATGSQTQLGQIAHLLKDADARATPLQRRLTAFGRQLSLAVIVICLIVFLAGWLRGEPLLRMGLTAISLAVAAIPEALPAVVTVLLALGARRLAHLKALVRHLPAVETLGSVTTICSDKTGTLTQHHMQVVTHVLATTLEEPPAPPSSSLSPPQSSLERAFWRAALWCNDARPVVASDGTRWTGDPTETALAAAASVHSVPDAPARWLEWPFDSERKRMSTLHALPDAHDTALLLTKGAPESVIPLCVSQGLDEAPCDTAHWLTEAERLAARGMRVLALAQRAGPIHLLVNPPSPESDRTVAEPPQRTRHPGTAARQVEHSLQLLGLVGLMDPPRPEARVAVAECLTAGIRPVMITGDHPATALAIARDLGMASPETGTPAVMTGPELAACDDSSLSDRLRQVSVFARTDPAQKIRIVQALQRQGEFVAMTGDGVNDAPALKAADIGVAMGQGGTDVAREASGLVLLDDHFATIVAAVREGRRIFDNIRKFIRYAMTGNSGEIWVLFLAPLLGLPMPLQPIHILWVNLVTDGLPGLALAAEPAERGVMERPPRPPGESVFAQGLWQHTVWVGLLIGTLCLSLQAWALGVGDTHWQSMVFTALTFTQMGHLLVIRSEREPIWSLGLWSNLPLLGAVTLSVVLQLATLYIPALQTVFHTQALTLPELALCVAAALVVMVAVETEKGWRTHILRAAHSRSPPPSST